MSIQDIIERLERASGPDRELDGRIWCAVNGYGFIAWDGAGCRYSADRDGWISSDYIKEWTASIDAALTLVSDQHYWLLGKGRTRPDEPLYGFQILEAATNRVIAEAEHEQLENCICIAALKARAPVSSKDQVGS